MHIYLGFAIRPRYRRPISLGERNQTHWRWLRTTPLPMSIALQLPDVAFSINTRKKIVFALQATQFPCVMTLESN